MPVTIPRDEAMVRQARKLYVRGTVGYQQVADILGISKTSVARYVNPVYAENNRRLSNEAKKRRTGVCAKCGGVTRYNGRTINGASVLCEACNNEPRTHCKRGHPLIPKNRVRVSSGHTMCRVCRNKYMREYQARQRREEGVPERRPYRKPLEEKLLAELESEEAAK